MEAWNRVRVFFSRETASGSVVVFRWLSIIIFRILSLDPSLDPCFSEGEVVRDFFSFHFSGGYFCTRLIRILRPVVCNAREKKNVVQFTKTNSFLTFPLLNFTKCLNCLLSAR